MNTKFTAIAAALALTATACSDKQAFSVEAKIEGVGTQNLTALWRTAPDGALCVQEITAVDNQFTFTGRTPEPALVEIYTGQGSPLLRFMVSGGDKVRLGGKGNDLRVSGSEIGSRFAEVLNRVNEDADVNASVAEYVRANPGDIVSSVLMVTMFESRGHERLADSLLASIDSVARPQWLTGDWAASVRTMLDPVDSIAEFRAFLMKADTIVTVGGNRRYVFSLSADQRSARMLDSLRSWADDKDAPKVADVFFGGDRTSWRATVEGDSATWEQLLVPGGPATISALTTMKLPVSITTDSAGRIIDTLQF